MYNRVYVKVKYAKPEKKVKPFPKVNLNILNDQAFNRSPINNIYGFILNDPKFNTFDRQGKLVHLLYRLIWSAKNTNSDLGRFIQNNGLGAMAPQIDIDALESFCRSYQSAIKYCGEQVVGLEREFNYELLTAVSGSSWAPKKDYGVLTDKALERLKSVANNFSGRGTDHSVEGYLKFLNERVMPSIPSNYTDYLLYDGKESFTVDQARILVSVFTREFPSFRSNMERIRRGVYN